MKEKPVIFIISYNRYSDLKKLIDRLIYLKQDRIVIIDNKSTYEPLLAFYHEVKSTFDIIYLSENLGPRVAISNIYSNFKDRYNLDRDNFIYTDCDVVPIEDCPDNFVELFSKILLKYPVLKVGFGLKIDDLPDCFGGKNRILNSEPYYWKVKINDFDIDLYRSAIDTTFSYRRANTCPGYTRNSFRTGYPYLARHLSWYIDSSNLSDEYMYYIKSCLRKASTFVTHGLFKKC